MSARVLAALPLAAALALPLGAAADTAAAGRHSSGDALLRASDTEALLGIARAYGSAEMDETDPEDPFIAGTIDGILYSIYFQDCWGFAGCGSLLFHAGWTDAPVGRQHVNLWNRANRYGRAYIDQDDDPVIEMDVNMRYGLPIATFADSFDIWNSVLLSFRDDVIGR